jgi:Autographiviridae endonuclease VII
VALVKARWKLKPGEKYDFARRIICVHGERRMYCKSCHDLRRRNWESQLNPDQIFDWHLRREYGVTVEWYRAKEVEQQGLCAICRRPERQRRNGKLKRLAVDHDHETGKARALLCSSCNMKVGVLEDSAWRAQANEYCAIAA